MDTFDYEYRLVFPGGAWNWMSYTDLIKSIEAISPAAPPWPFEEGVRVELREVGPAQDITEQIIHLRAGEGV